MLITPTLAFPIEMDQLEMDQLEIDDLELDEVDNDSGSHFYLWKPEQKARLEREGILLAGVRNGIRRVHPCILNLPTSSRCSNAEPLILPSASVRFREFDSSSKAYLKIPEVYESIAAIQFMGFTREKAAHIFGRWIRRPDPGQLPLGFFDYVFASVGPWRFPENVEAARLLTELGISEELKAVLLNPMFAHQLKSKPLAYWVRDTVKIRHETLDFLMEHVKLCTSSQEHVSDHGSPEGRDLGWAYEDYRVPSGAVSIDPENAIPPIPADHYVMYRPMAHGRHLPVDSEGEILLHVLHMGPGINDHEWLFYSNLEAAEDYREWIVARCPYAITWMVRIVLPYLFIDGLPRQFVSKKGPLWTIKKPRKYRVNDHIPAAWKENGTTLEEILQEELRGKLWIDIHPAVIPERKADSIQDTIPRRTSYRYGCTSKVVELGYTDGEWTDERKEALGLDY